MKSTPRKPATTLTLACFCLLTGWIAGMLIGRHTAPDSLGPPPTDCELQPNTGGAYGRFIVREIGPEGVVTGDLLISKKIQTRQDPHTIPVGCVSFIRPTGITTWQTVPIMTGTISTLRPPADQVPMPQAR